MHNLFETKWRVTAVRRSFGLFCRSLFNSGKTPEALICAANYCRTSVKKSESINEKVNTRIDTA
jgi:hypothetical protein